MIGKKVPVHLKCSEWLVNRIGRKGPVRLKCSEGLVSVSDWAPGAAALVAFKAKWQCSLNWSDS